MTYPPEPSHDDCTANTRGEWQGLPTMAIWYPSMGGYVAHAVAVDTGEGDLDVYVWHDGEFPFSDASPVRLHHCSAADFTRFGREIDTWLSKDAAPPAKVPATYDDAIRALLTVPSHETHVAADWLEARRDGREPEFATTPRSWSLPVIPDDVTRGPGPHRRRVAAIDRVRSADVAPWYIWVASAVLPPRGEVTMDEISEHLVGETGPEPITAEQLATAVIARAAHDDDCCCDGGPDEDDVQKASVISAALAKAGLLGITVRGIPVPCPTCGVSTSWAQGSHPDMSPPAYYPCGHPLPPAAPRSWSLPVIPDDVTRVRDSTGDVWCRSTAFGRPTWRHEAGGVELGVGELLAGRSPLTEEQP